MAATITVPTTASLGGYATEVATNLAAKGDYDAAGGTLTSTTHYFCPVAGRTAGVSGTGACSVTASVAAGTVNTADTSTIDILVTNW